MKQFGLIEPKSDFDSIYISTLHNLLKQSNKNKLIIKLFELPQVAEAFKTEVYSKNNWTFPLALDSNLHTNPEFRKLKNYDIDILTEINDFKIEFKNVINESRSPKEIEHSNEMKASFKSLNESINALPAKFGKQLQIIQEILISIEPNPIVEYHSLRLESRREIEESVRLKNWVSLYGSISTGKTQLAALIYSEGLMKNFGLVCEVVAKKMTSIR